MKNLKLLFLIIFLGSLIFFPLSSLAGSYEVDERTVYYQGMVPCGLDKPLCDVPFDDDGNCPGNTIYVNCQIAHLFIMIDDIVDFLFVKLIPPLAALILVIGGGMFIFAGGNPASITQAKSIMTSVLIGLVIIYAAWLIVGLFLHTIGLTDWTNEIYKNWWEEGFFEVLFSQ